LPFHQTLLKSKTSTFLNLQNQSCAYFPTGRILQGSEGSDDALVLLSVVQAVELLLPLAGRIAKPPEARAPYAKDHVGRGDRE
jgi:hypothetical protein